MRAFSLAIRSMTGKRNSAPSSAMVHGRPHRWRSGLSVPSLPVHDEAGVAASPRPSRWPELRLLRSVPAASQGKRCAIERRPPVVLSNSCWQIKAASTTAKARHLADGNTISAKTPMPKQLVSPCFQPFTNGIRLAIDKQHESSSQICDGRLWRAGLLKRNQISSPAHPPYSRLKADPRT
jgi:hypothetical protein